MELGSILLVILPVLGPEDDLGGMDCRHLALLVMRARSLARQVSANISEARHRLGKVTETTRPSL